jgi:dipeptidyl aminopeptidase/acylaminoacyl peptidase
MMTFVSEPAGDWMMKVRWILMLYVALLAAPAAAEPERLSAELLWKMDRLGAPAIAPTAGQVVVPVTRYDVDSDQAETRLWLLSSGEDAVQRPLTAVGQSASSPVFSPDGRSLAFVAKRGDDEAAQIYLLPMDAPGEARRLTEVPTGVSALRWVGEHLYFISSVWPGKSFEEMAEAIKADKDSKVSAQAWDRMPYSFFDRYLDAERENHLFRIAAEGGEVERLTEATELALDPGSAGTGDYDVSPDGRMLAFVADASTSGIYPDPDLFLLEIGSREATNLTRGNAAPDFAPMFSPDGSMLAFIRQHVPGFYADQQKLMIHELGTGRTRLVLGDWDRSAEGLVWSPDSAGLFGAIDDGGTRRVYFLPLRGTEAVPITGATDYDSLAIAADGTLVARDQSFMYPPRIVRIEPESGQTRRLETFNDALLADVELGSYEIQMWVHYPPGFDPAKKYPLFLLIHGGPHGAITDTFHFRWNAQTFASWGYVTAWHNFHGSTGFGQDFTDAINPDWVSKPYADTIAAAEWFAEQPWIDSDRMVAGGGSYGGYLSSILLGREHPFKSLVIHAAVYDLYAQTSADFAVHEQRFGSYWENPDIYRSISPHYQADKFDTPSLILHGQQDLRVPVGQAFSMFRALQRRGVESRLVYYPDENHWILKPNNSLNWYGEVRDWIARYAVPGPVEADVAAAE